MRLQREVETAATRRYAMLGFVLWCALMLGAGACVAAILGGCGGSGPRVIERMVTVPVHEPCAPPAPVFVSAPEPQCTPVMNPVTCTWPTPQAAQDFVDNLERLREWVAVTVSQCARIQPDGGP